MKRPRGVRYRLCIELVQARVWRCIATVLDCAIGSYGSDT
jgi:hypothetical protein